MELTKELLDRVCANARLRLSDQERAGILKDMQDILNAFAVLDGAETKNVQPSFHPIELKNKTRDDVPEPSLSQEDALKNSSQTHNGYFKGPRSMT